tara:strand:+ start:52 stop:231 length:180 start_codon:yes stop_codon:yes gene_type:complete
LYFFGHAICADATSVVSNENSQPSEKIRKKPDTMTHAYKIFNKIPADSLEVEREEQCVK